MSHARVLSDRLDPGGRGRLPTAIYARSSARCQRARSCIDQVRLGLDHLNAHGGALVAVLTDSDSPRGLARPGLLALLLLVENDAVDVVVCETLDRFARDADQLDTVLSIFADSGVSICQFADSTR